MTTAPIHFRDLKISAALCDVAAELGYKSLTPIQAQSIPVLLEGRDVIGKSQTGSGKTAAFAIPILQAILPIRHRVQALILCPTRELCAQVALDIRKLGRKQPDLRVLTLAGGQPARPQVESLKRGAHIVIGTPGRTLDHLRRGSLDLSKLSTLVLDEADRMLDMGFQEEVEGILAHAPSDCQTVLFSATFPESIDALSARYQHDPVRVTIEEIQSKAPDIRQEYVEVALADKVAALIALLSNDQISSAVVFCNMKAVTEEVATALNESGLRATALNGNLEQYERDQVMVKFRNGSTPVLVATDLAARGIDVADLDAVINFDLPYKADTYVHRIGRTGRAGKRGIAVSIATSREILKLKDIEEYTGQQIAKVALPTTSPAQRPSTRGAPKKVEMQTLRLSGGRKEKLRPGDILGALTGETGGAKGSEIGKIEIHDHFSYVAVAKGIAPAIYKRIQNGQIKGRKFHVEWVR
jgi:ATP-independent RNA helicase DbpA